MVRKSKVDADGEECKHSLEWKVRSRDWQKIRIDGKSLWLEGTDEKG